MRYQKDTTAAVIKEGWNPQVSPPAGLLAAVELFLSGFTPLPIRPGKKAPFIPWAEFQARPPDLAEVIDWYRYRPGAGVAVVTGKAKGLLVVDVDPKNGGFESLARFEEEFGELPQGPRVRTQSGGLHAYFRHPAFDAEARNDARPGIDIKGSGGYVVAPPSRGEQGEYSWIGAVPIDSRLLPPTPESVADLCGAGSRGSRRSRTEVAGATPIRVMTDTDRTEAEQEEFRSLWEAFGIELRDGEHTYLCVFHEEKNPSLGINSRKCLWHCFTCQISGGLKYLEELASEHLCRNSSDTHNTHSPKTNFDTLRSCPNAVPLYKQRLKETRGSVVGGPCKMRTCDFCGPRLRDHRVSAFLRVAADSKVHVIEVEETKWSSMQRRFERWAERGGDHADGCWLQCPARPGLRLIFNTFGEGDLVINDLWETITDALQAVPSKAGSRGRNVTMSPNVRTLMPTPDADIKYFSLVSPEVFDRGAKESESGAVVVRTNRKGQAVEVTSPPMEDQEAFARFASECGVVLRRRPPKNSEWFQAFLRRRAAEQPGMGSGDNGMAR